MKPGIIKILVFYILIVKLKKVIYNYAAAMGSDITLCEIDEYSDMSNKNDLLVEVIKSEFKP